MIYLRVFDPGPYYNFDPRFLDVTDVPFVLLGIVSLFIAFYKVKKTKYDDNNTINNTFESTEKFKIKSYDILMQPKKKYDESVPLIGAFKAISYKKLFVGFALCMFYYLIFTEQI